MSVDFRKDPEWRPPAVSSIDYCYVQPHHIPSVNAMCREFFWPGIDCKLGDTSYMINDSAFWAVQLNLSFELYEWEQPKYSK